MPQVMMPTVNRGALTGGGMPKVTGGMPSVMSRPSVANGSGIAQP
jgi:hypothetical protein